jgi:hypothetical protein
MSDRGSWLTAWRPGGGLAVKLEMPTKKTGRGRRPRRQRQQERERARGLLPTSSSKLRSLSLPDVPWPATGPGRRVFKSHAQVGIFSDYHYTPTPFLGTPDGQRTRAYKRATKRRQNQGQAANLVNKG